MMRVPRLVSKAQLAFLLQLALAQPVEDHRGDNENVQQAREHAADDARLNPAPVLAVPTLVLHGGSDYCSHPDMSAGKEKYFTGRYERVVIEGAGHFPQKEKPARVAQEILRFVATP